MYTLTAGKLQLNLSKNAEKVEWVCEGTPLAGFDSSDWWRLYLDDSKKREIEVRSSKQKGLIKKTCDCVDIVYDTLTSEQGDIYDIKLVIKVKGHFAADSGHSLCEVSPLSFNAEITNNSGVRVNEIKLPYIELSCGCDSKRENDMLYTSCGLGRRIKNPWENIKKCHSEYMSGDQNEIWYSDTYPSYASMAWFGMETGGKFLYIGRHDDLFRVCVMSVGTGPRNSEPRLIFTISHFPMVRNGETVDTAPVMVNLIDGDWRKGSEIYRNWADQNWWNVPERRQWVREFTGWQRVILKHQFGEIYYKYSDLPALFLEGKKAGIDTLLVFGWWKEGFDNGYPNYEPDDELGGAEALKKAIKDVQSLGGRVILYSNGVLIDKSTEYYEKIGKDICRKNIENIEYRENYAFSGKSMLLKSFEHKSFVSACQATKEWKRKLLEVADILMSFGPDSVFFDQMAGHRALLCYDESHLHGKRVDMEAVSRRENMKAIRARVTEKTCFGSEYVVDCFAQYLDYNHGDKYASSYDPNAFPEMLRNTFPEIILTNRGLHDERADFKKQLNYAFVYGMRFDVAIYRCRGSIKDVPDYQEHLAMLLKLKEKYKKYFYYGKFAIETDMALPEEVKKTEYVNGEDRLFVFWNTSNDDVKFTALGERFEIKANEFVLLERSKTAG